MEIKITTHFVMKPPHPHFAIKVGTHINKNKIYKYKWPSIIAFVVVVVIIIIFILFILKNFIYFVFHFFFFLLLLLLFFFFF